MHDKALDPTRWFTVRNGGPYRAVGLAAFADHRRHIEQTYDSTLETINASGGLDWIELWCALNERGIWPLPTISVAEAKDVVLAAVIKRAVAKP